MDQMPILGLYDSLLTQRLADRVTVWRDSGHLVDISSIDEEEIAHLLGRFVGEAAARALAAVKGTEAQVELANQLLRQLADPEFIHDGPHKLLSIIRDEPGAAVPDRPLTSLSEAALLTNAKEDPSLAHELAAELASADHVDLLCAFVKWSGLRILERPFEELRRCPWPCKSRR